MVNISVNLDWKSFLALGGAVGLPILAYKVGAPAAEHVLTALVGTCKNYAITGNSNC